MDPNIPYECSRVSHWSDEHASLGTCCDEASLKHIVRRNLDPSLYQRENLALTRFASLVLPYDQASYAIALSYPWPESRMMQYQQSPSRWNLSEYTRCEEKLMNMVKEYEGIDEIVREMHCCCVL